MKSMISLLACGLLAAAGPALSQTPYPGVVEVGSTQATAGTAFTIPVYLSNNNVELSAMTLPLKFSSPALTLDSVSLGQTVWNGQFEGYFIIDNTARTVRITVLPSEVVTPLPAVSFTDGILVRLYFRAAADATPHVAVIDSVYADSLVGGTIHVYTRVDLSDNTGSNTYLPDFLAGQVQILVATGVDNHLEESALPADFELAQNYPNPFNPATVIRFGLPRACDVRINVYNILGQQVRTLLDGPMAAGHHEVEFDAAEFPSGIYFYRLVHDQGSLTRKMILVK